MPFGPSLIEPFAIVHILEYENYAGLDKSTALIRTSKVSLVSGALIFNNVCTHSHLLADPTIAQRSLPKNFTPHPNPIDPTLPRIRLSSFLSSA